MTTNELMDAQIKAMGEELVRLKVENDRLRGDLERAIIEIVKVQDQARQLMNERDELRRMAEIAAKFGDLGGGR